MKLEEYTALRDRINADLDAGGGSEAGMDAHVKVTNKCTCRGKYRIKVEGTPCHGQTCCKGT